MRLFKLILLVIVFSTSSCTLYLAKHLNTVRKTMVYKSAPFTDVEKILLLKKGMSIESVKSVLGVDPYDMYHLSEQKSLLLSFAYRLKERRLKINTLNSDEIARRTTDESSQTAGEVRYNKKNPQLIYVLFSKGKMISYITTDGNKKSERVLVRSNNLSLIHKNNITDYDVIETIHISNTTSESLPVSRGNHSNKSKVLEETIKEKPVESIVTVVTDNVEAVIESVEDVVDDVDSVSVIPEASETVIIDSISLDQVVVEDSEEKVESIDSVVTDDVETVLESVEEVVEDVDSVSVIPEASETVIIDSISLDQVVVEDVEEKVESIDSVVTDDLETVIESVEDVVEDVDSVSVISEASETVIIDSNIKDKAEVDEVKNSLPAKAEDVISEPKVDKKTIDTTPTQEIIIKEIEDPLEELHEEVKIITL